MSLYFIEFLIDIIGELLVRLLVLLLEVGDLALDLDDLILDHLNSALIIVFVEEVSRNDKVLILVLTKLLLAVPGDQVTIFRDNGGSLLIHSTLPVLVDVLEGLRDYGHQ